MKNTTVFLLAMLCPFLWLGAQSTTQIKLDVCHNYFTYVADGPTDANGYSLRGGNFHLQGYIYPDGTFDTHGEGSGILANGDPEFPDEVIGTWFCSGWYIVDEGTASTGAWVVSSQLFKVNHPTYGEFELTSEGEELYDFKVPFYRAVVGATGSLKKYKGQMLQENLAGNASGFANVGFVLELEDAVQSSLTDGSLSFLCQENLHLEAPPNSGGMVVEWETPSAISECTDRGIGCAATAIDGFTYLCEWEGNHYYLSNEALPWEDARGVCQAVGGRLATVDSEAENQFLAHNINMDEAVFIGLNDVQAEGAFQWTDGSPISFTNWDYNEPSNTGGAENYIAMHGWSDGKWADYNFWTAKRYLMEFNCELNPVQTSGPMNGSFLSVGLHEINYEVMDDCGNIAGCSFQITIEEHLDECGSDVMNLALNQPSSQSGTQQNGNASLANDGNTDGDFWSTFSVAITNWQKTPWWEVDLGAVYQLSEVQIFNRTDCCTDFLQDYYILISEEPFQSQELEATLNQAGVNAYFQNGIAGTPSTVSTIGQGRYLRIQRKGNGLMSVAEVMVMGCDVNTLLNPPIDHQQKIKVAVNSFVLFPNPTSGNLNIRFDENPEQDVLVNIFNLQGQLVKSIDFQKVSFSTLNLNVENLNAGTYMLAVKIAGKETLTQPFFIENEKTAR
ncbi:MAG: lectin-like protein [Saprospiraceae bacterium]